VAGVCQTGDILYLLLSGRRRRDSLRSGAGIGMREGPGVASTPKFLRWGPYEDRGGWVRGLAITLCAAIFMAMAGAFGSDQGPLAVRFAYWIGLMLVGWLWGAFVSRYFFRRVGAPAALWLRILVSSLGIAVPFSVVVALAGWLAFRSHYDASTIPKLVGSVTVVTAVMVLLNVLIDRNATVTSASDIPPKFLDRLPLKLRGAEIWAVEAEDHYLRLHTSKGQDLILLRLADAISELDGIEGAQAHRSWWVARDAITDAERGDGRATLTLKDGSQVPVSRTYARALRAKGWF
jgi:DNA-binding LytR/AlgR family response regulator